MRTIVGKTLTKLSRSQYFFNDEPDDEDEGDAELVFSDGSVITLFILSDGESVGAESTAMRIPDAFEAGDDAKYSWARLSLTDESPWSSLIGCEVTEVRTVFDKYTRLNAYNLSGWKVVFGKCGYFGFFNCGDNARMFFDEAPATYGDVETREMVIDKQG